MCNTREPSFLLTIGLFSLLAFFLGCNPHSSRESSGNLGGKYARAVEELAELQTESAELERQLRSLRSAQERAERERDEWKQRSADLEESLQKLQPEILPQFRPADLTENHLVIQRAFSIRTGQCFDRNGASSCFFFEIPRERGGGYVLYKANRVFFLNAEIPQLHNSYGERLSLVTQEIADMIRAWEAQNPHHSIRVAVY